MEKSELFNKKETGWKNISKESKDSIFKFSEEYIYFLNVCWTYLLKKSRKYQINLDNGFHK